MLKFQFILGKARKRPVVVFRATRLGKKGFGLL